MNGPSHPRQQFPPVTARCFTLPQDLQEAQLAVAKKCAASFSQGPGALTVTSLQN